ncbi:MAG TPA: fibronectin type III domain-containing protein [Marmoricola sp.]|jgi:hypothetical protein|nr:fibronectin type III domain-containing protein [Marmoricola sp.]
MARRTSGIIASLALLVGGLAVTSSVAPAVAAPDDPVPSCTSHAAPCLVSFTRDGAAVDPSAYRVAWNEEAPGSGFYSWYFEKFQGSFWNAELGADEIGHTYAVTFDFGTFNPRTAGGLALPETSKPVSWSTSGSDHRITLRASPIYRVLGCTGEPTTCPTTATPGDETHGWLSEVVNDGRWFGESAAEHAKIAGFYNLRNTDVGSDPPVLTTNAATGDRALVFTLQNTHADSMGTVFSGFAHLRLPDAMLRDVYGVPDPDTMTSTSLLTTINGGVGTITIHPEAGHAAMLIDITGVTFSKRTLKVLLGTIVPTKPTSVRGKRRNAHTGVVRFAASHARGSRATGYVTRCSRPGSNRTAHSKHGMAVIHRLKAGKHYTCKSRAVSKAGNSPWSSSVRL